MDGRAEELVVQSFADRARHAESGLRLADNCLSAIEEILTAPDPDASWHTRKNQVLALLKGQRWERKKLEETYYLG